MMENSRFTFKYLPDFAGLFGLTIFVFAIATVGGMQLRDGDPFWHIKAGTVMLEKRELIHNDFFSHTAYGQPWIAHEWLSEIIMAGIHQFAGLEGLACFFLLVVSLSYWVLYKITEKGAHQLVTLACVTTAVVFSASHMAARPHLFSWLFMVTSLAILNRGGKSLFWLPALMLPWVNLHGGFIICLVLQGIFIAGALLDDLKSKTDRFSVSITRQRVPILILFLSLLVVGINPFGYELLLFPFQVSRDIFVQLIPEWKPINFGHFWYFRYYLVALVLLISLASSKLTWTERLLIILFLNAALTHTRHISLMVLAVTPTLAKMVNALLGSRFAQGKSDTHRQLQLSATAGPVLTIFLATTLIFAQNNDSRLLHFMEPTKIFNVAKQDLEDLTLFLRHKLPEGKMFNEYSLGGYLIYAMEPAPKVFIDGRADMYGEQIFKDYYNIVTAPSKREKLLEQYGVNWVVYNKDSDLVRALNESGRWVMVYQNTSYVVFVRRSASSPRQPATTSPKTS